MFTQHPGNGGLPQRCVERLKKGRGCPELILRDGQLNPKLEKKKGSGLVVDSAWGQGYKTGPGQGTLVKLVLQNC